MSETPYGGKTTVLSTLPVGTRFFVWNGHWHGAITRIDGVKHVHVFETDADYPFAEDETLDIEIRTEESE